MNHFRCLSCTGLKIIKREVLISSLENMGTKCLKTLSDLFSRNLINQSSCRILTTYARTRPILHDNWSIRLGENRPDRALQYLAVVLPGNWDNSKN